jgi:hypothetical protein
MLESRSRQLIELKIQDEQCRFTLGRDTMDQIFTLRRICKKTWKYDQKV